MGLVLLNKKRWPSMGRARLAIWKATSMIGKDDQDRDYLVACVVEGGDSLADYEVDCAASKASTFVCFLHHAAYVCAE